VSIDFQAQPAPDCPSGPGNARNMLLTMRLWLCLLDAGWADRMADNLAGFRNEY